MNKLTRGLTSTLPRLQQQAQHLTTMSSRPDITLYTDSTPNGIKISIGLEELGLPYKTEHINISTNKQKEPWFLEINPNGRVSGVVLLSS